MEKGKILIVEDSRIVAEDIKQKLMGMGYTVCAVATSGKKALEAAALNFPDIALMDIKLGDGMNGIDTAVELRAKYQVPVIYLTAYADEDTLERAKHTEPFGYIVKPFEDKDLRSAIEIALYKHQMEHRLKVSEEWLRTTLGSIGDGVIATDMKGCITFMNPVAEALTGWIEGEIVGKPMQEVFHIINESTRETVENPVTQVLKDGRVVRLANHTLLITKNGREIPIADSGSPIKDDNGKIVGVVLVFRDQTKERAAQKVLEKSITSLQQAETIARLGYFERNWQSGEGYWSRGFFQLLDIENPSEAFTHEQFMEYIHEEDLTRVEEHIRCSLETHEPMDVDFRLVQKNGNVIYIHGVADNYYSDDGKPLLTRGTFQDVTKEMESEKLLRQAHKMESIGTLAGGIAHDFNNILGIIIGNAELAHEDIPDWSPARANVKEIKATSLRARDIVRQLLSFSRKTEPEKKPIKIGPIIEESKRLLRSFIPSSIELRTNIPKDTGTVNADPTQVHQVLINLCMNGVHAMEESGGILEINLCEIFLAEKDFLNDLEKNPGPYVHLMVTDTGHGMEKSVVDRIFDPYFTTKEVGKGTGMGLAVVHGIIQSHNGFIKVRSELGKGTVFNVFFPMTSFEQAEKPERTEELFTGNERILFVDDEDAMVQLNRQRLERLGYSVTGETNPLKALEHFRCRPESFDLIITDMTMPQMGGDNLVREILKIKSNFPIILCTGYSDRLSEERAKEIGISKYIEKPIEKETLARSVREVLDVRSSDTGQHRT